MITGHGVTYEFYESVKCPACGGGMYVSMTGASSEKNPVTIFCNHSKCKSESCSSGAEGRDIEQALEILTTSVVAEEKVCEDRELDRVLSLEEIIYQRIDANYDLAFR